MIKKKKMQSVQINICTKKKSLVHALTEHFKIVIILKFVIHWFDQLYILNHLIQIKHYSSQTNNHRT